ncbi:MAG: transcriptional repressor LexA [Solirubrobacteraceae bacterium]|nr:transcriptional repressor LexA [Solirubrobacteraceae bacterium]
MFPGDEVLLDELTDRQRAILACIRDHIATNGYPPAVRDIGKSVGLSSSSTVHAHLARLEKMGLLRRDPSKPRAMELLGVEPVEPQEIDGASMLPLMGAVPAGPPSLASDEVEEVVAVPSAAGGQRGEFLLRVKGDSMIQAGIFDGDLIVVHQQPTARNGEIVVALIDDNEATVKTFYKEADHFRLQPENDALDPIIVRDVQIAGVVVGLLRSF